MKRNKMNRENKYEILTENEYILEKLEKELKKEMNKNTPEEKIYNWCMFVTSIMKRNKNFKEKSKE